jgi:Carboxypeptidase regulatory-like domain
VLTNGDGYYTFLGLPEGSYAVRVSKRGLPNAKSQVTLAASSTMMLNLKLLVEKPELALAETIKEKPIPPRKDAPKPKRDEPKVAQNQPLKQIPAELPIIKDTTAVSIVDTTSGIAKVVELASLGNAGLDQAVADAEATEALRKKIVDKSASIVGGVEMIYRHLQYPYSANFAAQVVNVAARIYVNEKGGIIKVDMIKTGPPVFNEEVYRVLTEDIKFTPAEAQGKSSAGTLTVVVEFKP